MNLEEAGEIVLKGIIWQVCEKCRGQGFKTKQDVPLDTNVNHQNLAECEVCKGAKAHPHPDYVEACKVIGKPVPTFGSPLKSPTFSNIQKSQQVGMFYSYPPHDK